MVDTSALSVSALSDPSVARVQAVPATPMAAAPTGGAPQPVPAGDSPAATPESISSPRSLDGLSHIAGASAGASSSQAAPTDLRDMQPAQLKEISIIDLSLSQIAGLSWQALKDVMPVTE